MWLFSKPHCVSSWTEWRDSTELARNRGLHDESRQHRGWWDPGGRVWTVVHGSRELWMMLTMGTEIQDLGIPALKWVTVGNARNCLWFLKKINKNAELHKTFSSLFKEKIMTPVQPLANAAQLPKIHQHYPCTAHPWPLDARRTPNKLQCTLRDCSLSVWNEYHFQAFHALTIGYSTRSTKHWFNQLYLWSNLEQIIFKVCSLQESSNFLCKEEVQYPSERSSNSILKVL